MEETKDIIFRIHLKDQKETCLENKIFSSDAQEFSSYLIQPFNHFQQTTDPTPGFNLYRRDLIKDHNEEVEVRENLLAFIPFESILLIVYESEDKIPEKNLVLYEIED